MRLHICGAEGPASRCVDCEYFENALRSQTWLIRIFQRPDDEGEVFWVKYNPNHRWKYVRGLSPDEGVLIKWLVTCCRVLWQMFIDVF
jgi:hypothetical protein